MEKIRNFVNRHNTISLILMLGVVIPLCFSCSRIGEDTLNELLPPEDTTDTTSPGTVDTDTQAQVEEPSGLETLTFTIDATNTETWAYFSFASGDVVEIEDAENSEAWDIGFQATKVKLNGGTSGTGMGSVIMLTETTFEAVTEAPADGYKADTDDTLAIVHGSGNGWYIYTGPPTHQILPLEDRVFVLKAADGTFAKVQFLGYYKDNENKEEGRHITFKYVHQPDGSHNF
ncbi:hypothetical protein C6499_16250 [Candidatus Poribacteria bacterium]|nr:MAG: hypothetical protein C6499_16250 [Candidatus Poribacteria bacterium]